MIGVVSLHPRIVTYYTTDEPGARDGRPSPDPAQPHVAVIEGQRFVARYLGELLFRAWPEGLRAIVARDLAHQREKAL
jgi:hypothetical protein